jgi:hypothetical protein
MAHYALIDSNNIVVQVITGVDENVIQIDSDGTEVGGSTEAWEAFYASRPWFEGLTCKRTSYNGNIRANFAGIGYIYDIEFDVFIAPRPFPSWKLNYITYKWEAPVAMPEITEEYFWIWSEYNKEWIKFLIPQAE